MGHIVSRVPLSWEHPKDSDGKCIPLNDELTRRALHSGVSTMAHHLVTGMLIRKAIIAHDDRNNPPSAVESGYPNLNLTMELMRGGLYVTDIGPNAAALKNGIPWEQVYA